MNAKTIPVELYMCVVMCANLQMEVGGQPELVFSFNLYMGSGDQSQIVLHGMCLYSVSHPAAYLL